MKELNAIRLMRIKQDIQDEAAYLCSLPDDIDNVEVSRFAKDSADLIDSLESSEEAEEIVAALQQMHEELADADPATSLSLKVNTVIDQVKGGADEWHYHNGTWDYSFGYHFFVDAVVTAAIAKEDIEETLELLEPFLGPKPGCQREGHVYNIMQSESAFLKGEDDKIVDPNLRTMIRIYHREKGVVFEAHRWTQTFNAERV